MIQSIGIQKFIFIIILAALACGGYFYNSTVTAPAISKSERAVRTIESNLNKMTNDTNNLVNGLENFAGQREEFEFVEKTGFFDDQNRVVARSRIEAMRLESLIRRMSYSISPAETVTTKSLRDAGYKILNSKMEFVIGAVDDTDIYKFIYLLNHGFPGQVLIIDIDMRKEFNLTQPLLRNIGLDAPYEPLVRAIIVAQWQTMVPDTSFVVDNEGGL